MILASHRGPRSLERSAGGIRWTASAGGLVEMLKPALKEADSLWISIVNADDIATRSLAERQDETALRQVALPALMHQEYYGIVSTALWNVCHGLLKAVRGGRDRLLSAWGAYRAANQQMAEAIAAVAAPDDIVIVHDYHLMLVPGALQRIRPDLRVGYFHHIPFPAPEELALLGPEICDALMRSLATAVVGLQAKRWETSYLQCQSGRSDAASLRTFVAPVTPDAEALRTAARGAAVDIERARIRDLADGRHLIVRVDRGDPMKNIVAGIDAVDMLLEHSRSLVGTFVFLHHLVPTRESVAEYRAHADTIDAAARRVNERWGCEGWEPVVVTRRNDRARALAAMIEFETLLVNPVREGMNLVAQEAALLNAREGSIILSTTAGSYDLLQDAVVGIDPLDVPATAHALGASLGASKAERATAAAALHRRANALPDGARWHARVARRTAEAIDSPHVSHLEP